MRVKSLVASAAIAAALPLGPVLASGSATNPSGPQGTGWYGIVDPLERNGAISTDERTAAGAGAGASAPAAAYDRDGDGVISPSERAAAAADVRGERRRSYSGPSWATNPPVPAP